MLVSAADTSGTTAPDVQTVDGRPDEGSNPSYLNTTPEVSGRTPNPVGCLADASPRQGPVSWLALRHRVPVL